MKELMDLAFSPSLCIQHAYYLVYHAHFSYVALLQVGYKSMHIGRIELFAPF